MFNRSTKLRLRRLFRRRQRQVESATATAEEQFELNLIARFEHLMDVKRFVLGWMGLAVALIIGIVLQLMALSNYYQTLRPIPGGIFNEGIVGSYSNVNPIYATGAVDSAVSHLIFAGLLTYNDQNNLVGDLASSYSVDSTGKHYTVHLRPGLTWQDGQPLTAADVVFTYQLIQDPDATSPLMNSWRGIKVSAVNDTTIRFDLPNALSSFPYSLTNGIVPKHILENVPADQLRSSDFNTTRPVGAGPFAFKGIQIDSSNPTNAVTLIALEPFAHYHAGMPKLDGYIVKAYRSSSKLIAAYRNHDVDAMAGLNEVPPGLHRSSKIYNFIFSAENMVFFKTSDGVLSDVKVRQALIMGANTASIISGLGYDTTPVTEPLLVGQLGYNPAYQQASYNPQAAMKLLAKDGWVTGKDGIRVKKGERLSFRLYAHNSHEDSYVLRKLTAQWRKIGVDVQTVQQSTSDFQTTLEFHTYDALLYGISIGVDPDVYAYWGSSQADIRSSTRLNFSEYKSKTADTSLEAGRTRSNPLLRVIKYKPFLKAWQNDAPALGLYQPRYLFITSQPVAGLNEHTINSDTDLYNSVANWEIRTARITN